MFPYRELIIFHSRVRQLIFVYNQLALLLKMEYPIYFFIQKFQPCVIQTFQDASAGKIKHLVCLIGSS